MVIGDDAISGTLKYVADYSAAFPAGEDSGNYMALKVDATEGATVTAEVVGGLHGPVTLDADGIFVAYITATTQKIKVVATKGAQTVTNEYALTDLTLESE